VLRRVDRFGKDRRDEIDLLFRHDEGREETDHAAVAPAQLEDQSPAERLRLNLAGELRRGRIGTPRIRAHVRVDDFHADHQAAAANVAEAAGRGLEGAQVRQQPLPHDLRMLVETMGPHELDGRRAGGHGHLVASKRAGVRSRLPEIQLGAVHDDAQGKPAADRLGHHQDVGSDTGPFERQQRAGAPESGLDLVDDQRNLALPRDSPDVLQPRVGTGNDAALSLDHLQNHRGGRDDAAVRVVQEPLDIGTRQTVSALPSRAERTSIVIGIRKELHVGHEPADAALRPEMAGQRQSAVRHAVIGALKREDRPPARHRLDQLDRRLHRVGSGRTAELDTGIPGEGLGQSGEQRIHELVLHRSGQVERLERDAFLHEPLNGLQHDGMVVPQRQRAGAGQTVDVGPAVGVFDVDPLGPAQRQRQTPRIASRVRFALGLALEVGIHPLLRRRSLSARRKRVSHVIHVNGHDWLLPQ